MSYRIAALMILMFGWTTAASAQTTTPRIAGPASTSHTLMPVRVSGTPVASAALGYDAMHRAARKPNVTGGIIGFVVGAAAGATVGCLANKDDYGVFCAGQNDTKVVVGALVGGAAGAAVGALLFKRK